MHPRRGEIEAALDDLRTTVPGGSVVDTWRDRTSEYRPTPEKKAAQERRLDRLAAMLDLALRRTQFKPIDMPEGRCPPDGELLLAWAMHRGGAALARYPACSERTTDTICLGHAYESLVVYQGPLRLEGQVKLRGTVVVLGDLTIDGGLVDGYAEESALVVVGNEKVRALSANTDHLVTGDFDADLLFVPSEEATLNIGGRCTTRLTLAPYWKQNPGGGITVNDFDDSTLAHALRGCLAPGPGAGPLEADAVFERVATGQWTVTTGTESDPTAGAAANAHTISE